jgi:hypothetical protein
LWAAMQSPPNVEPDQRCCALRQGPPVTDHLEMAERPAFPAGSGGRHPIGFGSAGQNNRQQSDVAPEAKETRGLNHESTSDGRHPAHDHAVSQGR